MDSIRNNKQIIEGLEKIIRLQIQYGTTLKETAAAERKISDRILAKWLLREQTITDWDYSYWVLQDKFTKALKEIRFLKHYIETKIKKKKGKKNAKKKV